MLVRSDREPRTRERRSVAFSANAVLWGVFSTAFALFHVEATAKTYTSELPNHLNLARTLVAPDPLGFKLPHPGFHWLSLIFSRLLHLSLADAAVLLLASVVTGMAAMIVRLLSAAVPASVPTGNVYAMAGSLLLVSSIYYPPVSENFYLGQGSPNFWAVPTLVVVKPFALWSLLEFGALLGSLTTGPGRHRHRSPSMAKPLSRLAASLFFGVLMKPSFFIAFAPVAACAVLLSTVSMDQVLQGRNAEASGTGAPRRIRRLTLPQALSILVAFLPSVILLGYQYFTNYHSSNSRILVSWLGVWRLYTHNVVGSLLLAMAFPLAILATRFRSVLASPSFLLAWGYQIVATLQFALFAEERYFSSGNFAWGYNIGLWLLFLLSGAELFRWLATERRSARLGRWLQRLVSLTFCLHLTSGIAYLVKQLLGGSYV